MLKKSTEMICSASKVHEYFEMLFFTKKNIFLANELFGVAVNH